MGARIASLRRQAGLSQAQLAEALGIPQRTLSFYEREAGDIPAGLAPPMARRLTALRSAILRAERRSAASSFRLTSHNGHPPKPCDAAKSIRGL